MRVTGRVGLLLTWLVLVVASSAAAEPFKGTCKGLKDYIKNKGVIDAKGRRHPGYAGWTTYDFQLASIAYANLQSSVSFGVAGGQGSGPALRHSHN